MIVDRASGLTQQDGAVWPDWSSALVFGGLAGQMLVRLSTQGGAVTGQEWLLEGPGEHIRDVRQGPDEFFSPAERRARWEAVAGAAGAVVVVVSLRSK